jgi:hypothetical protein
MTPPGNSKTNRRFSVQIAYRAIPPEQLTEMACWGCREMLDLHQPDPNQPDRFLSTCPGCGRWYWVVPKVGEEGFVMLDLPEGPPAEDARS